MDPETYSAFDWLLEDEEKDLFGTICAYVSLGQFELARALFPRLLEKNAQLGNALLLELISGSSTPRSIRCPSVPSSAHLSWLCTSFHHELFPDVDLPPADLRRVQGNLLFEIIREGVCWKSTDRSSLFTKSVVTFFRDLFSSDDARERSFPRDVDVALRQCLISFPALTIEMLQFLPPSFSFSYVGIIVGLIIELFDIQDLKGRPLAMHLFGLLVALPNVDESHRVRVFTFLAKCAWDNFSSANAGDEKNLLLGKNDIEISVLEQLLAHGTIGDVEQFSEILDEMLRAHGSSFVEFSHNPKDMIPQLPFPFTFFQDCESMMTQWTVRRRRSRRSTASMESPWPWFWKHFYDFCRVFDEHPLALIVRSCVEAIRRGDFSIARALVVPFPELVPLIVVIALDDVKNDVQGRDALVTFVDDRALDVNGSPFQNALESLKHQQHAVWWIAKKLGTLEREHVNEILRQMNAESPHSLLFLVSHLLHEIPPQELVPLLSPRDRVFIYAYHVLRESIEMIQSSVAGKKLPLSFHSLLSNIRALESSEIRADVCELAFSLLFLRKSDIDVKDEGKTSLVGESEASGGSLSTVMCDDRRTDVPEQSFVCGIDIFETFLSFLSAAVNEGSEKSDSTRFERLRRLIADGEKRLSFVKALFSPVPPESFFSLLLADPKSFLHSAIRFKKFDTAVDVATAMGDSERNVSRIHALCDALKVREALLKGAIVSADEIGAGLSPIDRTFVLVDLAICSSTNRSAQSSLLRIAREVFQNAGEKGETEDKAPQPESDLPFDRPLLWSPQALFKRLEMLIDLFPQPLGHSIQQMFKDFEGAELQESLSRNSTRAEAISHLHSVCSETTFASGQSTLAGEDGSVQSHSNFLREIIDRCEDGVIAGFCRYLIRLGDLVKGDCADECFDLFGLLGKSASELIAQVSLDGRVSSAEEVASLLREDFATLILSSTPSLISPDDEPAVPLPVLRSLASSAPLLAVMAILVKSPTVRLVEMAQDWAKGFPALERWISIKRSMYRKFCLSEDVENETIWQTILGSFNCEGEVVCCDRIVDELADPLLAVSLADASLPNGAEDFLLKTAAEFLDDDFVAAAPYVARIKERAVSAPIVLNSIHQWDFSTAADLVSICLSSVSMSSPFYDDLVRWDRLFKLYASILAGEEAVVEHGLSPFYENWQALNEACAQRIEVVLRRLIEIRRFDLVRSVAEEFDFGEDLLMEAEGEEMIFLLERNDRGAVLRLLESVDHAEESISLVLPRIHSLASRLFLVNCILSHFSPCLSPERCRAYSDQKSGLRILLLLPDSWQEKLRPLTAFPNLIVESLLMGNETSLVKRVFQALPECNDDDLLISFAEKALWVDPAVFEGKVGLGKNAMRPEHIETKAKEPDRGSEVSSGDGGEVASMTLLVDDGEVDDDEEASARENRDTQDDEDAAPTDLPAEDVAESICVPADDEKRIESLTILTGKPAQDSQIRASFCFHSTPDMALAKAHLDLCESPEAAGLACLTVHRRLSGQLSLFPRRGLAVEVQQRLIGFLHELLLYAKLQFLKNPETHDEVALCDSLLSRVEIMRVLLSQDVAFSFTLADLAEPNRARQMRDRLMKEDRMALAIELAKKCNVETEPVWFQWGFELLQMGRYREARKKLRYALERGKSSSEQLEQIVLELETAPPPSVDSLRGELLALRTADPAKAPPVISAEKEKVKEKDDRFKSLSEERFAECVHYLSSYGSQRDLVVFLLRHDRYARAIAHALNPPLPLPVFLTDVFGLFLRRGALQKFRDVLIHEEPSLVKSRPYLLSICKYLDRRKEHRLLYDFQVFMKDDVHAGMTSIRRFTLATKFQDQLEHLRHAKAHFEAGVSFEAGLGSESQETRQRVQKESDIARKHLKSVNIQIGITETFLAAEKQGNSDEFEKKRAQLTKLHVFRSEKALCDLAHSLLLFHFYDLSFSVVSAFRLPLVSTYIGALDALARSKQSKAVSDVLRSVEGAIDEDDLDTMICESIRSLVAAKEISGAQSLLSLLSHFNVEPYLITGKLKAAFLIASKENRRSDVELILEEAKRTQQKTIVSYCENFLAKS